VTFRCPNRARLVARTWSSPASAGAPEQRWRNPVLRRGITDLLERPLESEDRLLLPTNHIRLASNHQSQATIGPPEFD